jgi:protein TonB
MRLYTLVVSIVAHAAILIVLVIVPLVAMDAIPAARGIKAFIRADAAELPQPPPPPATARAAARPIANVDAGAPFEAPNRIEPETPTAGTAPFEGPPGVDSGFPGGTGLPNVGPPTLPPPVPRAPIRVSHIRPPQKLKHVAPVYPAMARANKVQGIVILEAVIGEDGRVRDVRVLRSIPLLDTAAIEAVRQWVFSPTSLNGEPVPVVMTVTVAFELK